MTSPRFSLLLELTEQLVAALGDGDLDRLEQVLAQREAVIGELQQVQAERPLTDDEKAILGRVALWQRSIEEATENQRTKMKEMLLSRRQSREGAIAYARSQSRRP